MTANILPQAYALAQSGRPDEAVSLLESAIAHGEAGAMLLLGLWQIEGDVVPRDLASARNLIANSAAAGLQNAARIHAALQATGLGGQSDWQGALDCLRSWANRDPLAARQLSLINTMAIDDHGDPTRLPTLARLSDDAEVHHAVGLFSADECAFLIDQAASRFAPARIFHEGERRFQVDPVRDSENAGFPMIFEHPVIHALNRRIASLTGTAPEQAEPLQLLRYGKGQQYRLHLDAVPGLANQRIQTALVYLNDEYDGGATCFPDLGVAYRGGIGDALIFANTLPDGRPDPTTRHNGEVVSRGTKIVASRWIRQRPPPPGQSFGPHEAAPGAA